MSGSGAGYSVMVLGLQICAYGVSVITHSLVCGLGEQTKCTPLNGRLLAFLANLFRSEIGCDMESARTTRK